jgi:ankyrin repeat protein
MISENTKKKWNALIWACCSGYTSIVKILLSKGAGQQYLEVKPENRHVAIGSTK